MPGGYDKDKHPDPPWEWVPRRQKHPAQGDDGGVDGDYWRLRDSADSSYNCTTYTVDKVQGKAPDGTFIPTEEATDRLTGLGYTEMDGSRCGCEEGKIKNCTVVYRNKDASKTVFHAAALDPRLCDWGGKLTGSAPIIRFKRPEDYLMRYEKSERDNSEMVFYCKDAETEYISDEDLARNAKKPSGSCLGAIAVLASIVWVLSRRL